MKKKRKQSYFMILTRETVSKSIKLTYSLEGVVSAKSEGFTNNKKLLSEKLISIEGNQLNKILKEINLTIQKCCNRLQFYHSLKQRSCRPITHFQQLYIFYS